jgi:hypothetical protein
MKLELSGWQLWFARTDWQWFCSRGGANVLSSIRPSWGAPFAVAKDRRRFWALTHQAIAPRALRQESFSDVSAEQSKTRAAEVG